MCLLALFVSMVCFVKHSYKENTVSIPWILINLKHILLKIPLPHKYVSRGCCMQDIWNSYTRDKIVTLKKYVFLKLRHHQVLKLRQMRLIYIDQNVKELYMCGIVQEVLNLSLFGGLI